jgi:hypothetical protein
MMEQDFDMDAGEADTERGPEQPTRQAHTPRELSTPSAHVPAERPTHRMSTPTVVDPMQMIARHVEMGGSIEQLEKLYELQQRWQADEARKAWNAAMTGFKADPPIITKNKHVSYASKGGRTEYDHATLDEVANKISAAMAPHGLSFRWETEQADGGFVTVTCIVAHRDGHSERTALTAGRDQSGGKNDIQSIGSAVSYLQRYTLKAATGMAESGQDDDGAATRAPAQQPDNPYRPQQPPGNPGGAQRISDEQSLQIEAALAEHDATSRNGLLLKLRRFMPDSKPPLNIADIPAIIFNEAVQIAQGQ